MINRRSKGMKNERKTAFWLMRLGYKVFRLYQPRGAPQGELDMIAVKEGEIKFVQVKSNRWNMSKELRAFADLYGTTSLIPSVELWRWDDRRKEQKIRVLPEGDR